LINFFFFEIKFRTERTKINVEMMHKDLRFVKLDIQFALKMAVW